MSRRERAHGSLCGGAIATGKTAAGGPATPAGRAAFEASLLARFNQIYAAKGAIWAAAPSNPTPATLFAFPTTYVRPEGAYLALRQIVGPTAFDHALQGIQRKYGGGNIDEAQLEAAFHAVMANRTLACSRRLDAFFSQWFDTAYPTSAGITKPQITGANFSDATGACG